MDYSFLCASGSNFLKISGADCVIKSNDGFNSYLLIVNIYSKNVWIFLTAFKPPPLQIVDSFLDLQKLHWECQNVLTNLNGEFYDLAQFSSMVSKHSYQLVFTLA